MTAWRDNADKAANFQKDDIVYVEGRILTDSYEDQSTGQRKWTTEVDARQVVNFNEVLILFQQVTLVDLRLTSLQSLHHLKLPQLKIYPLNPLMSLHFKDAAVEDSDNNLEEDVPFNRMVSYE